MQKHARGVKPFARSVKDPQKNNPGGLKNDGLALVTEVKVELFGDITSMV